MFLVPHQDHHVFAFVIVGLLAAVLLLGIMTVVRVWRPAREYGTDLSSARRQPPAVDQAFAELRVRLARGEFIEEE
jgi:uncharacterized membrane protein